MNAYFGRSAYPAKQMYVSGKKVWKVCKGNRVVWQLNTVDFVDWDGATLSHQEVVSGNDATKPADPTREGYTFTGWSEPWTSIIDNTVLSAQYEADS